MWSEFHQILRKKKCFANLSTSGSMVRSWTSRSTRKRHFKARIKEYAFLPTWLTVLKKRHQLPFYRSISLCLMADCCTRLLAVQNTADFSLRGQTVWITNAPICIRRATLKISCRKAICTRKFYFSSVSSLHWCFATCKSERRLRWKWTCENTRSRWWCIWRSRRHPA